MELKKHIFINYLTFIIIIVNFNAQADTVEIFKKTKLIETLTADKVLEIDKLFKEIERLQTNAPLNRSYLRAYSIFIRSKLITGQFDIAKEHLYKALRYAKDVGDIRNQGILYSNLGVAYMNLGRTDSAVINFETANTIFASINDKKLMASTEQNLGGILLNLNQIQKGLAYCQKAYTHFLAIKDSLSAHYALLNSGLALKKSNKLDSAYIIFNSCYKFAITTNDPELIFASCSNLADLHISLNQFEKAELFLAKMLFLSNQLNSKVKKAITYMGLSAVYEAKNQLSLQKQAIDSAIYYHENLKEKFRAKDLYLKAANIYQSRGDFKKANEYLRIHYAIFSEINENSMQEKIVEYEAKYNNKSQQVELALQEQKLTKQRLWVVLSISAGILLIFLILILSYRNKLKLKLIQKQSELNKAQAILIGEENERQRTAKELHDSVCSSISAVSLQLIHANLQNSSNTKEKLTPIVNQLQQINADVRSISHNLQLSNATEFNFNEQITNYIKRLNLSQSIQFNYSSSVKEDVIKEHYHLTVNLFRIFQELMNNALKHSKATDVYLQLHIHGGKLVMSYEDNGIGFDTNTVNKGLGFKNIHQRTQLFKGTINIDSSPKGSSFSFIFTI
jgi:signal transduction histidine kinase